MEEFNASSDIQALSDDHSYHMETLQTHKYAYIADKSSADQLMAENCQVTIAKELFSPFYCSIALQKGSPYTDDVDET